jgi:hypothetical protein
MGYRREIYRAALRLPGLRSVVRRLRDSPRIVDEFISGDAGAIYGLRPRDKLRLVEQFDRVNSRIQSGTYTALQLVLAREILSIPREKEGDVVECGCWKGASSASLSLVCQIVKRRLIVCDSFEGLPDDGMNLHVGLHFGVYGYYRKGMFEGRLEEVQQNISTYGEIRVCEFIKGFFSDTLRQLSRPIVCGFLDVDLVPSTYDCLRYIWPLLVDGGAVYTDDAGDLACVRPFFNDAWWKQHLGCDAPGYIGSGCGLPLNSQYSSLGYARKVMSPGSVRLRRASHLYYPEEKQEEYMLPGRVQT